MTAAILAPQKWTPATLAAFIRDNIIANENAELWNQGTWVSSAYTVAQELRAQLDKGLKEGFCGTQGCVAGWAAILAAPDGSRVNDWGVTLPTGQEPTIHTFAQTALGLDDDQSSWLFAAERDRDEVLEALDLIAEGRTSDMATYVDDYYDEPCGCGCEDEPAW